MTIDGTTGRDGTPHDGAWHNQFWGKLKRVGARLPFVEDLLAAYFCAFDRDTPARVRLTLAGALAYFVLPVDVVPDILPAIGFTDDAAVLAIALKSIADHLKPAHRKAARAALTTNAID